MVHLIKGDGGDVPERGRYGQKALVMANTGVMRQGGCKSFICISGHLAAWEAATLFSSPRFARRRIELIH